jgi:hypothetical protein
MGAGETGPVAHVGRARRFARRSLWATPRLQCRKLLLSHALAPEMAAVQQLGGRSKMGCSPRCRLQASPKSIRKSRRTFVDAAPRLRLEGPPDQCAAAGPALPKERTPRASKGLQNWAGTCRGGDHPCGWTGGHQQLFHLDSRCSGVQWIFM